MDPSVWGPPAWLFLHSITFNYPDKPSQNDKKYYSIFFDSLKNVIPCPICRKHYSDNLIKIPIRLDSRDELIRWLIDIHNSVNKSNHKPTLSYESVYEKYDKLYNKKENEKLSFLNNDKIKLYIGIIILLIVGYFIYINDKSDYK